MQTAKKTVVPFASRAVAPKDLKQRLEGIAADVSVVHWASSACARFRPTTDCAVWSD